MILRCRRRRLEGARIARGLNSLLESCDANGALKREIYAREEEQLPSESIALDIACFFSNNIDDVAEADFIDKSTEPRISVYIVRLFSPNLYLSRETKRRIAFAF